WAQQVFRPRNSAQGWWEPLIIGTTGVQTQEPSTGMVGTPHNGHSRCSDPNLRTGMVGTPHNGHSRCVDLGAQNKDGGNPS
ncbi:unnamed protein product, partial [Staurois parvus]